MNYENILNISTPFKILLIVLVSIGLILGGFYVWFIHAKDPYHKRLTRCGFSEKKVQIGSVLFNYAQGPNNGPPLVLLHAQHMDWYSYSRVLSRLSQTFQIFAIDYHGHGLTQAPSDTLNANQIGHDLAQFIESIIKEPVYCSGNSSGGILATWLGAHRPDLIRALILEDPALLSSEYPRVLNTIADKSFAICSEFLKTNQSDFLLYWVHRCRDFFKNYVGFDVGPILEKSIKTFRKHNPSAAVEIAFLPPTVRLMMRGMDRYDPHFGAAFHNGMWNQGFDHADAVSKIQCPTLLLHANFEMRDDGILNGAINQQDADYICSLNPNIEYKRIDSQHVIHLDHPALYCEHVEKFLANH